ncbi:hypothetical protein OXYTRIMIC_190 [Oxytricha trifallax]|uniref:Uncharacterized protein n=1 Tax=Oxytricha trifallax TaxID=1172189 RepID=A0A073HZC9_9SPIT|nr:hypothetical protein OXYTRIMIC_190 [Oxytricha trifallax]
MQWMSFRFSTGDLISEPLLQPKPASNLPPRQDSHSSRRTPASHGFYIQYGHLPDLQANSSRPGRIHLAPVLDYLKSLDKYSIQNQQ